MNRPLHLPGFAAVAGGFPAPIEFVGPDIFPDHTLQDSGAIFTRRLALQDHLAAFEFPCEIEIATLIVHPGLLPFAGVTIKYGNAVAAQGHGLQAGETLVHDAAVEDTLNAVRAVADFTRLLSGPGQAPFADPEVELLLLGTAARWCRRRPGLFGHS